MLFLANLFIYSYLLDVTGGITQLVHMFTYRDDIHYWGFLFHAAEFQLQFKLRLTLKICSDHLFASDFRIAIVHVCSPPHVDHNDLTWSLLVLKLSMITKTTSNF